MPAERTFSEELIQKLTVPDDDFKGVIRNIPAAKPSAIRRDSTASSLGHLDLLPTELLLLALAPLDFQSLSRLSRVCLRAKTVVENLPAYKDMMAYVPEALTALGLRTRILEEYPASRVHRALRDDRCVSCLGLGWFLYLPTCERVCYRCLHHDWGLIVVYLGYARRCFGLKDRHFASIPAMYDLPKAGDGAAKDNPGSGLYCVREAKRLSIDEAYGSLENAAKNLPRFRVPADQIPRWEQEIFARFREASLEPTGPYWPPEPWILFGGTDYDRETAIRIPRLTETGPDRGHMCMGCDVVRYRRPYGRAVATWAMSKAAARRAAAWGNLLPREAFLEHIKVCDAVGQLLAEWGDS
ncbi:uncharacterized protein DNG_09150 [Cephalotrichum gorgonifer]|uniref:F-box domain-containing protein n=1 Tax=Cephalotrichum gorgonifer TaxID=2041049 RepID=A0AAE8N7Y7_9PEZI|nr:uncharacterized protein DNG_09150 [Cephalotrichum gorgonifer]